MDKVAEGFASVERCLDEVSCAGSVDENEDEQGIAHIVEHVTFLGSSKRDQLLGTGARSNAYTDFHHTVFHVHSPLVNTNVRNSGPMLPQVCLLTSYIQTYNLHVLSSMQIGITEYCVLNIRDTFENPQAHLSFLQNSGMVVNMI